MANEPKTHILWHGQALCGLRGLPRAWPAGHKWVALDDREHMHDVDCQECMNRAHEAGIKYISPNAREGRCPGCSAQIFIDDELCTIHHAAPVCAEFERRAAGALNRSVTILDKEKRN